MIERIIWFVAGQNGELNGSNEDENKNEPEHAAIEQALLDIGLRMTKSEDPEDLRLWLTGAEPVLLVAELGITGEWEGWSLISDVRKQGIQLPVLVISSEGPGAGAVAAFKAGANDYMAPPVHIGELKYRILNLLILTGRRRSMNHLVKIDGLMLDPSRRHVNREGKELKLTNKEFDLLYYLAANAGQICPRDEILRQVWGFNFHADTNVVDVYIRHIRLKVDKGYRNKLIHTVRGSGYVMRAPD